MDPSSGGGGGDGPCPDSHRCFTAGSRQAPDPHDQFLERENYYRKHTPRDPSSLFRCISEQLFDTQHYYRRVRDECCAYMRRNRDYFESHVDGCFDEYMQNMSCFRQRGTLLELRALAYRYRRNVILFEPYTLGNSFIQQAQYGKDTFLVFVAPDYHFDTVYTRTEIEDAAYCQSLVYQTLYEDVFKLPDVGYAVERMLHDHLGTRLTAIEGEESKEEDKETPEAIESCEMETSSNNSKVIAVGAVNQDGRQFVFDGKKETKCILEDYRMCHFHNESFAEYLGAVQTVPEATNNKDTTTSVVKFNRRREDSFLKVADVSCVRQLLNDGITPFPYKVAKALDPHIYRNIEFDVWSEMRKLSRSRYMYRRFISVGDKCFVRLNDAIDQQGSNPKNLHSITVKGGGDNNNNKKVATINSSSSAAAKVYVGYVQHIEKFTNLYHVYVEELRERLIVHGNTVRSCPAGGGVSRDFTVIGLNGGGRVFNKYHRPTWKYPPPSRPGVYPSSTPGSQYAPKQFIRNINNSNNNQSGFRGAYSSYYHRYTYQYNNSNYYRGNNHYNHSRRFSYYNNNNSRHQSNANSDAEDDMSLLKKRAALMDTGMNEEDDDPFQNELSIDEKKCNGGGYDQDINNNNNSHHVNLKELLCSTYYYAESAKYFQCNDIIAMPAFITTTKKEESDNNNDEQRNNRENLKRNSNKNGGEQNPSQENKNNGDFDPFDNNNNNKLDDLDDILPTSAVDFVVLNPTSADNNVPLLVSNNNGDPSQFPVDNNNIAEDMDNVKLEEQYQQQQLVFEQQQQQYQVTVSEGVLLSGGGDPAMYVASGQQQQQFYANTATGSLPTYYMPATAMDSGAAYYQPYYHRNGAVVSQAQQPPATAPYYCNYVYSNATGAMQTVTPYLLTNGGVAASGGANFNGSVYGQQFDGQQLIPIQNAIRRRDLLYSETPVNVNSTPSYSVKGNDLPSE